MKLFKKMLLFGIIIGISSSCISLKPYERVFVNDPDMQVGVSAEKEFANYVFSIREGGMEAGGHKAGGGCGCN